MLTPLEDSVEAVFCVLVFQLKKNNILFKEGSTQTTQTLQTHTTLLHSAQPETEAKEGKEVHSFFLLTSNEDEYQN